MGTEVNYSPNENEKINEEDIIENDCYEEIDMRKINQIIEKEKNWNTNTIIYSNNINIINISNEIEEENIKEEEEKKEEEDKKEEIIKEEKEKKDIIIEEDNKEIQQNTENNDNNNNKNQEQKKLLKIIPRIRPQNTSDEVLNQIPNVKKKSENKNKNIKKKENNNKEKENNNKEKENKIQKIMPKNKLDKKKEDEVIYSGILEKIINEPQANKIIYTKRFCVLTKKTFAYYKSKESYISLNRPMFIIEKNDIIRIENTFIEGEGYFGIVCEVNDKIKNLINKVNSFVTNDENGSQLLLGFRSNKYEDMANWILMLNYFISDENKSN
jgi:hypothetical protein